LKDQTAQQILGTNPGTFSNSVKAASPRLEPTTLETAKANVQKRADFEASISLCQSEHIDWYETTEDVLTLYMPKGLAPNGFFIYKNVKVCPIGKASEIEEDISTPYLQKVNPDGGKVSGNKTRVKVLSKEEITTLEVDK